MPEVSYSNVKFLRPVMQNACIWLLGVICVLQKPRNFSAIASAAKQKYTQFDTITAPLPKVTYPTFYTAYIFYLRITFNSTATVII